MFDIGFSELIVIAIVALVVIGPERLPRVARTAGHMLGRLQRYVNDVKTDIDREMQLDELKRLQAQVQESANSFENSLRSEAQTLQRSFDQGATALEQDVKGVSTLSGEATPPAPELPPPPEPAATGTEPKTSVLVPGVGLDGPEAGVLLPPLQPPPARSSELTKAAV